MVGMGHTCYDYTSYQKMNAIKLKKQFDLHSYQLEGLTTQFGLIVNGVYRGIRYFKVQDKAALKLLDMIPERYQSNFDFSWVEINCKIPIHVDSINQSVINIYYKTGDAVTNFYKPKVKNSYYFDQTNAYHHNEVDQESTQWFQEENVDLVESFIAHEKDGWVLNTSQPHSVNPSNILNGETFEVNGVIYSCDIFRTFVQIYTATYQFDQVCEMLQATGYID